MKTVNIENYDCFLALCEEEKTKENQRTMYAKYFINNSSMSIDTLVENPFSKYALTHKNIEPKSYVKFSLRYFDWEFDWSIETSIILRTGGIQKHIDFKMPIYFIASEEELVPVLNMMGRICLPLERPIY